MKNTFKVSITALAIIAFATLSGCIRETPPQNGYPTWEQVEKTPAALEGLVNGIPAAMVATNLLAESYAYDMGYPGILIANESGTGDLVITNSANYDHYSAWGRSINNSPHSTRIRIAWTTYYKWIKIANDLIKLIDEDTATDEALGYLGIAYGLRAKCYLDLVRLYGYRDNDRRSKPEVVGLAVPIITEDTTEADAQNNPRATVDKVYELIFSDLDKAEVFLEDVEFTRARINKFVIYGLKAEAYMERATAGVAGAYAQAATYADKVIGSSNFSPLTETQWMDPVNGFNNMSSNQSWIWGLPQSSENVHNLRAFSAHMATEESWTSYGWRVGRGINKAVYERIPSDDWRKYTWLDPTWREQKGNSPVNVYNYQLLRPIGFYTGASSTTLMDYAGLKFRPANGDWENYKNGNAADVMVMRVEEMMFIKMEATAHTDLGAAKQQLNDFMALRWLDAGNPYDCSSISTVDEFITELIFQKRIEFWGEGIIMYDLKRLGMKPEDRGYPGTNSPANYRLNFRSLDGLRDNINTIWNPVIPETEMHNNIGITTETNNPDPTINTNTTDKDLLWKE